MHKAVGSSLDLFTEHPKTNLTEIKWKFNQEAFAECNGATFNIYKPGLFNGRLHVNLNDISVTLQNLQLNDSGIFQIVQQEVDKQYDTKKIQLHVYGKSHRLNQQILKQSIYIHKLNYIIIESKLIVTT